jgi:hypothetical protein
MSEKSEAKRAGHKLQPNSGRGKIAKGDATSDVFVIDYKEASKSFTMSRSVWAKVCTDAYKVDKDKHPQIRVIFGDGPSKVRLSVVESSLLDEMESIYIRYLEGDLS